MEKDLNKLGISELMLLYYGDNNTEYYEENISDIITKRIIGCRLYQQEEDINIYDYEQHSIYEREDFETFLISDDVKPQTLFNFFFRYIYEGNLEDPLFDELIIIRNLPTFMQLELYNIENRLKSDSDKNNKQTLLKVKEIFNKYKTYDYEDIYIYLLDLNPDIHRFKNKFDRLIKQETKLMKSKITRLKNLIASGEYLIDYEDPEIYSFLPFEEGKVLDFKQKIKVKEKE